jgi:hypothetical protein
MNGNSNGRGKAVNGASLPKSRSIKSVKAVLLQEASERVKKGKKFEVSLGKGSYGPIAIEDFKLKTGRKARTRNPSANGNAQKTKVVPRREYVGDVDGEAGFSCSQIRMQPGDSGYFPWLAEDASLYERYKIRKFAIEFEPNVTGTVDGGQRGTVCLSFNYDPASSPHDDLGQALDCDPHVSGLPTEHRTLHLNPVLCTPESVGKFVRTVAPLPGQGANKFDFGVLNISVEGTTAGFPLGKIFFNYEIELISPQLVPVGPNTLALVSRFENATEYSTPANSYMALNLFLTDVYNYLSIENDGIDTVFLRPGTYRVNGRFYLGVNAVSAHLYQFTVSIERNSDRLTNSSYIISRFDYNCPAHENCWTVSFDEFVHVPPGGLWGAEVDATRFRVFLTDISGTSYSVLGAMCRSMIQFELLSASPQ